MKHVDKTIYSRCYHNYTNNEFGRNQGGSWSVVIANVTGVTKKTLQSYGSVMSAPY
jgi:hypothetical protein